MKGAHIYVAGHNGLVGSAIVCGLRFDGFSNIITCNRKETDLENHGLPLIRTYDGEGHVNVGVGEDMSIRELAELVKQVAGYEGTIVQDLTKPDDTPPKLLNVSLLHSLGWKAKMDLANGVRTTYQWFLDNQAEIRK